MLANRGIPGVATLDDNILRLHLRNVTDEQTRLIVEDLRILGSACVDSRPDGLTVITVT